MVSPDMRDPFFANSDRNMRRQIFAAERHERATGRWSPWEKVAVPHGKADPLDPEGWTRDIHTVLKNTWLVVMVRDCNTALGIVGHASIVTAMRGELSWNEKQRVKDELFGPHCTAIEIFPTADHLVDAAMVFHLWILPPGFELPFGLAATQPCSRRGYRPDRPPPPVPQGAHDAVLTNLMYGGERDAP